jgi:lysozyme
MTLKAGIDLIKKFEGCRLKSYPDPGTGGKPYTIGWGSTKDTRGKPFGLGATITQAQADTLLMHTIEHEYLPALKKILYWGEMNANQQGAILSFAYNLGANFYGSPDFNTITRVLKNKEWVKVPDALYLYRNPGTSVEVGLARRRKAEGDLWKK